MKRSLALVVVALVLCSSLPAVAAAENYRSAFGFEISLPKTWLVLTRDDVAERSDLLLGAEDATAPSVLDAIAPENRRAVFDRIARGELEIFYRRDVAPGSYVDNINVLHQRARFPATPAQIESICKLLRGEFARVFGRPITMDACELRDVMGRRALYLQFDGAVEGTKSMQYQLERRAGDMIVLTASIARSHLARTLGEFESMISSIRFD